MSVGVSSALCRIELGIFGILYPRCLEQKKKPLAHRLTRPLPTLHHDHLVTLSSMTLKMKLYTLSCSHSRTRESDSVLADSS